MENVYINVYLNKRPPKRRIFQQALLSLCPHKVFMFACLHICPDLENYWTDSEDFLLYNNILFYYVICMWKQDYSITKSSDTHCVWMWHPFMFSLGSKENRRIMPMMMIMISTNPACSFSCRSCQVRGRYLVWTVPAALAKDATSSKPHWFQFFS